MLHQLVIVGGGIAGAASALRAAQNNIPTLWILGDRKTAKSSRSKWVKNVDNMIGVHPDIVLNKIKTEFADDPAILAKLNSLHFDISTQDIVDNVKDRLKKYSHTITLLESAVKTITKFETHFQIEFLEPTQPSITTPFVIVATGLMDFQPTIYRTLKDKPSPKTAWIYPYANEETVLYCARCEGHLTRDHKTAIIGFSDTAAQIATMLYERYGQITHILLNGETSQIQDDTKKLLQRYQIEILPEKIIDLQSKDNHKGALHGIVLENQKTIFVDYAFVAMGLFKVYHHIIQNLNVRYAEGPQTIDQKRVLIDAKGETHEPNLFCVGDMAVRPDEAVMMQIYTAQEYAVRAVDTIDRRIRSSKR